MVLIEGMISRMNDIKGEKQNRERSKAGTSDGIGLQRWLVDVS